MASNLTLDPRSLPFERWSSTLVADLNLDSSPPPEALWKAWALTVYMTTNVSPDPTPFRDWREWALAWLGTT